MDDAPRERHAGADLPAGGVGDAYTARQAERLARAARAAEELCGALWEALHEELHSRQLPEVAMLSTRLAEVCATVADLAGRAAQARNTAATVPTEATATVPTEATTTESTEATATESTAVTAIASTEAAAIESTAAPGLAAMPSEPYPTLPDRPVFEGELQIAIHDARGEGPAAWVQAIGANLESYVREALPFAVLLVEVVDIERLVQAESAAEIAGLLAHVDAALRQELRPHDGITLESRGRWWLTAPQVDGRGARALAGRLAHTVRSAAAHRRVPLELAIGIALCPEDGRDAATLAAHADVGLYAARAGGQPLAPEGEA